MFIWLEWIVIYNKVSGGGYSVYPKVYFVFVSCDGQIKIIKFILYPFFHTEFEFRMFCIELVKVFKVRIRFVLLYKIITSSAYM